MGLLDNILARASSAPTKAAMTTYPDWMRAGINTETWRIPEMSSTERQAELYKKLSWLQIAVALVAQTAAGAALGVLARQGEEKKPIPNHPFETLLQRPNPLQSRFEILEATFSWLKVAGNCYWWLNKGAPEAEPSEIWIIPAHQVQPIPDGRSFLRGYMYDAGDGQQIPLETWEVCHFKRWNPLSKFVGLSLIESIAVDATGDLAAQRYNANFYGKDNAKADGILAFKDFIEQGRWERLQSDWKDQHGGTQNKRLMMLRGAGEGVSFIPTQMKRSDMQYIEQRDFTKEQIFNLVAPGLASVLAVNATEANSTAGKDTLLSMAIWPMHVAVAEKIGNDILPAYGDDLVAEFEDVRRVDTEQELREQEMYARFHTVDEVRAKYYGDGPMPEPPPIASLPPMPQDAVQEAGKALDRQRWQTKALKWVVAGRGAEVPFDPDYLSDDEAMQIRAALKRASSAAEIRAAFGGG